MKNTVYSLVGVLLIGVCGFDLQAQNTEDDEGTEVQKVKINVVINEDGETKTITKEFVIPDNMSIEMEGLEDFQDIDADIEDGVVKVVVRTADGKTESKTFTLPEHSMKMEKEKVAYLGVKGYTTNKNTDGPKQVRLMEVIAETPAANGGLQNEDILLSIDGEEMDGMEHLANTIRDKEPGQTVKVEVLRNDRKKSFNIKLGERETHPFDFSNHNFNHDFDFDFDFNDLESIDVRIMGLSKKDRDVVNKSLGIDLSATAKMDDVELEVYPNPGDGDFNYTLQTSEGGKLEITVLDDSGKTVIIENITNNEGKYKGTLDLSKAAKGSYILIFKKGDQVLTEKLVKS